MNQSVSQNKLFYAYLLYYYNPSIYLRSRQAKWQVPAMPVYTGTYTLHEPIRPAFLTHIALFRLKINF